MADVRAAMQVRTNIERHLLHYGRDFMEELILRSEGSYLYTAEDRAILDFSSGQMCATIGHNHPKIVAAMARSGQSVIHLDSTMLSPDVLELAHAILEGVAGLVNMLDTF